MINYRNIKRKPMKKIVLLITLFCSQAFSQTLESPLISKPNFFPRHVVEKVADVSLDKISIDEIALKEIQAEPSQIKSYIEYYHKKTQSFFFNKKIEGFILVLVDVSAIETSEPIIKCNENPTQCSLTKINFVFSENINQKTKDDFLSYIDQSSKDDHMEIFIRNFSYTKNFRFGFQLNLDNKTKNKMKNDDSIEQFISGNLKFDSKGVIDKSLGA